MGRQTPQNIGLDPLAEQRVVKEDKGRCVVEGLHSDREKTLDEDRSEKVLDCG